MAAPADTSYLSRLPNELLLDILDYLHPRDVGSITQANRAFHQLFTGYYFDRCSKEPNSKTTLGGFWGLFYRVVKLDSLKILHHVSDINPEFRTARESCLHLGLAGDAPHALSFIVKGGARIDWGKGMGRCDDLTNLCLALSNINDIPQREKDEALTTACSHALPRVVRFLLAGGADPNSVDSLNSSGMAAIHMVLKEKVLLFHMSKADEFDIFHTIGMLMDYGANVLLPTRIPTQSCDFNLEDPEVPARFPLGVELSSGHTIQRRLWKTRG